MAATRIRNCLNGTCTHALPTSNAFGMIGIRHDIDVHPTCPRACATRIVFGAEPSNEEILHFIQTQWNHLRFSHSIQHERKKTAGNPKRRQRIAAKEASKAQPSTKAQLALAEMHDQGKQAKRKKSSAEKKADAQARFHTKKEKRKQKHRGH